MPSLLLRFPGGRYHATPTGYHVNEGQIEWPPCPWRLLRCLLACGYNAFGWIGNMEHPMESQPPPIARALMHKLSSTLPSYALPTVVGTHTRHYMPLAKLKAPSKDADKTMVLSHQLNAAPVVRGYKEDTTLVFDTWAQVGDQTLVVTWDVDLSDEERQLLAALAERLGYLGRSESWVDARLASADEPLPTPNCLSADALPNPGPGWEQVPVLAVQPAGEYDAWRERVVAEALAPFQPAPGKKLTTALATKQEKAKAPYPLDLIACLQADTNWRREHGWSQAPGSRRVFYWRPSDSLEAGAPRPRSAMRKAPSVEAMLLSLATESGNDHALPPITRALPQAERLHRTLGGLVKRLAGHSPVLSGCDPDGRPLKGAHEHAHILPLDLDGDQHIEHILIWAPMGLDDVAQAAVRAMRRTWTKGGVGNLKVALEAIGPLKDLGGLPSPFGQRIGAVLGPPEGARHWISLTPFVPPRFLKPKGTNSLEGQIAAERRARGHPEPIAIVRIDPWAGRAPPVHLLTEGQAGSGREPPIPGVEWARFRHFVRRRRKGAAPPVDCGFAVELRFAEPVKGPICLGYGSHFGLGLFSAAADGDQS